MLLEEEDDVETCIYPMLQYYTIYFYNQPTNLHGANGWLIIRDQIYGNEISCQTLIRMSLQGFTRLYEILYE